MRIYRLKFHSALHVDAKGSNEPATAEECIRSDTLSAALTISHAGVFGDDGPELFENPPFRVGSAFPFLGDILLFPAPVWGIWETRKDSRRKSLKKIRWISRDLFETVISGKPVREGEYRELPLGIAISKAEADRHPGILTVRAWALTERQRVGIDRLGIQGDGNLFFFGLQFFAPHAGLWFAAEPEDAEKFRAALTFLGDSGIGADRNSGLGHFKVDSEDEYVFPPTSEKGCVTLSLFNPEKKDRSLLTRACRYHLITRSGWISGFTIGRPPIRVFTEGSYFPETPAGRVVPMIDETVRDKYKLPIGHSAPRDFRALCLPCARPWKEKEK